tara:strand:+ start:1270 stop:1599 length:330 start_codon:yes stop_codon:yes gene_type:complete
MNHQSPLAANRGAESTMTIGIFLARIGGYQTIITRVANKIAISILLLRIGCQRTVVTNIGPAVIVVTVDDRRQGGIEGEHVERKGAKAPLKGRAGVGVVKAPVPMRLTL